MPSFFLNLLYCCCFLLGYINFIFQDFIIPLNFFSYFRFLPFVVVILVLIFLFYLIEFEHPMMYLVVINYCLIFHFGHLNYKFWNFIVPLSFFSFVRFLSFAPSTLPHKFLFYLIEVENFMITLVTIFHFLIFHFEHTNYLLLNFIVLLTFFSFIRFLSFVALILMLISLFYLIEVVNFTIYLAAINHFLHHYYTHCFIYNYCFHSIY